MSRTQPILQRTAHVRLSRAGRHRSHSEASFLRTISAPSEQYLQTLGLRPTLNRSASTPTLILSTPLASPLPAAAMDQSDPTSTRVKGQTSTSPTSPTEDVPRARGEQTPNGYRSFVQRMGRAQANSTSVCTCNITASRAARRSVTIDESSVFANSSRRIARKQTPYRPARSSSFIRRRKMVHRLSLSPC